MNYIAYHFEVDPREPGSEILMATIADMGFESFDETPTGFTAYIKESDGKNLSLNGLEFDDFKFSFEIEKITGTNWNEEWEKNFEPVEVEKLLLIRAPFHEAKDGFKEEIVIMPKMSFGTGHHQTTRLMCRQLFETDLKNKRVLDMGCGTAILAILAKKLGATDILGIDIDDWCVENSIENCETNNCPEIKIVKGDIDLLNEEQHFDCIIANINKNILKAHLPGYSEALLKGGDLFLSGFFITDIDELKEIAEKCSLEFKSYSQENEWAMMYLKKTA